MPAAVMLVEEHEALTKSHKDHATRIQILNDEFRRTFVGGRVMATRGVMQLDQISLLQLIQRVRYYDGFDKDNDPYGEHDFGVIEHHGQRIFWKIDYYDVTYRYGSPDPTEPTVTGRLLTVMLAEEW